MLENKKKTEKARGVYKIQWCQVKIKKKVPRKQIKKKSKLMK